MYARGARFKNKCDARWNNIASSEFPSIGIPNRYILVATDYISKYPAIFALPNQKAVTIVEINNWISRYGMPLELPSNQERNIESTVFK